jgi:hypothetical protein
VPCAQENRAEYHPYRIWVIVLICLKLQIDLGRSLPNTVKGRFLPNTLLALNMNDEVDFQKWECSIGKLILACSRVEYEIMRLYEKWMPNRNYYDDTYEKHFDTSIGVVKDNIQNGEKIADMLISMKQFAAKRHLVAHNPIHYSSASPEAGEFFIFDLKGNELRLSLKELEQDSYEAYCLSIDLCYQLRVNV